MKTTMHCATRTALLVTWLLSLCSAWAFYNPTTGRWLSRDPVEESGGHALYVIGRGDLIRRVDFLGLVPDLKFSGHAVADSCGGFRWPIRWWVIDTDPDAPQPGGVIVQRVSAVFAAANCTQGLPLGYSLDIVDLQRHLGVAKPVGPSWYPLYEGWTVPPNSTQPTVSGRFYHDQWNMPPLAKRAIPNPLCTKGEIQIIATAEYYPAMTLPDYFQPIPDSPAGALPMSFWFLPGLPASATKARSLKATWDCCFMTRQTVLEYTLPDF